MGPKKVNRVAAPAAKPSVATSILKRARKGRYGGAGKGGGTQYLTHLRKKEVLSTMKTRQLQLASKGRYKYFVLSKIFLFLKEEFLKGKERRLTLEQLLTKISEPDVSDEMKEWLTAEGLPTHSKIRVVELPSEKRYAYQPPIKKMSQGTSADILKLLKSKRDNDEGGLLQSLLEESMPMAEDYVKSLLAQGKIYQVTRVDRKQVLFYKEPSTLSVDSRFVELWRRVDISNKTMSQIKQYLKIKRISIIDDEAYDKEDLMDIFPDEDASSSRATSPSRKRKSKSPKAAPTPRRRKRKIRDNVHVMEDLQDLRFEDGSGEPGEVVPRPEPDATPIPAKRRKKTKQS